MANPSKPDQPKGVQSSQPHSGETYKLKCADAGHQECPWEARGSSPDEVMRQAEQHGREQHHLTMDENTRNQVRSKIQRAA